MENHSIYLNNPQNQELQLAHPSLKESLSSPSQKNISTQSSINFVEGQSQHIFGSPPRQKRNTMPQQTSKDFTSRTACSESKEDIKVSNSIVLAGYLQKYGDSFIKPWTICYCVLSNEKLLCYQNQTRTQLISCVNFQKVKCETKIKDDGSNTFDLIYGEQQIIITFKTRSSQQTSLWINHIQNIINSFLNKQKIKIRKGSKELYHEKDTLSEQEFFQLAETGDLLLMKSIDSKCALQRLVTNSQYDHVSLVVKIGKNQVKIFEANADEGVQLYDWDHFHRKFSHYQKICFRKLCRSQEQEFNATLLKFIKGIIGSKYQFSALKLFRKLSDEENVEKPREFFCSELVAKSYKILGLLDNKKASSSYWPVDFTERGGIALNGESYLGFERLILLEQHLRRFQ